MKDIFTLMEERQSCRAFEKNKPIPKSDLEKVLKAVQNAPTSVYGQQYSAITINDPKKLQELCDMIISKTSYKGQKHIGECSTFVLFVADFNKMKEVVEYEGKNLKVTKNIEALLTGAVDVGIALGVGTVAAESLGLGSVCIGALRGVLQECIDYFELPKYVLPICGLCLGYPLPTQTKKKLRLPYESFVFEDKYKLENFKQTLKEYNELTHKEVYGGRFFWTTNVSAYYSHEKYPQNLEIIKNQGFEF